MDFGDVRWSDIEMLNQAYYSLAAQAKQCQE